MNRRNFLKLFGLLLATPAVANAASKEVTEPRKGMVVITVELEKDSPYEQFKVDTGVGIYASDKEWKDLYPTTWGRLACSDAYYCSEDKEITISFSNGSSLTLEPTDWNDDMGEFDSIQIVKNRDIIEVDVDVFADGQVYHNQYRKIKEIKYET
jgi:hypothetical protein